jgi:ABC-type uncharacterized transport system substrate-binding protein
VRARADLDAVFEAAVRARSAALVVLADALMVSQARAVAALARTRRLPAIFPASYFVERGRTASSRTARTSSTSPAVPPPSSTRS